MRAWRAQVWGAKCCRVGFRTVCRPRGGGRRRRRRLGGSAPDRSGAGAVTAANFGGLRRSPSLAVADISAAGGCALCHRPGGSGVRRRAARRTPLISSFSSSAMGVGEGAVSSDTLRRLGSTPRRGRAGGTTTARCEPFLASPPLQGCCPCACWRAPLAAAPLQMDRAPDAVSVLLGIGLASAAAEPRAMAAKNARRRLRRAVGRCRRPTGGPPTERVKVASVFHRRLAMQLRALRCMLNPWGFEPGPHAGGLWGGRRLALAWWRRTVEGLLQRRTELGRRRAVLENIAGTTRCREMWTPPLRSTSIRTAWYKTATGGIAWSHAS